MTSPLMRLLTALMDLEVAVTKLVDVLEDDFEDLDDIFDEDPE